MSGNRCVEPPVRGPKTRHGQAHPLIPLIDSISERKRITGANYPIPVRRPFGGIVSVRAKALGVDSDVSAGSVQALHLCIRDVRPAEVGVVLPVTPLSRRTAAEQDLARKQKTASRSFNHRQERCGDRQD